MDNNLKVSILISCYNYEDYVGRCLESCKKQTYWNYEVIIVDDASTDDSKTVIEQFIKENPEMSIRFVPLKENGGPAVAKGTALKYATGDYVIFVDCDDWMDDDCLEVLAERAAETGADKIRAQARVREEASGKVVRERTIPQTPNIWCEGMMHATLIKRKMLVENNILFCNDRNVSDDLYFIARVNECVKKTEYVRKTVYTIAYKEQSDSGVKSFNKEKKLIYNRETNIKIKEIYDRLDENNKILCEYLFAKQYFFMLLQYVRAIPFGEIGIYHKELRATIDPYFPKFYKNKNIKLSDNGDPRLFRTVMWICAKGEQFHYTNLMLKVYWLLAKKMKFVTR